MSVYLSASSINDFIKCPQRVMYRFGKTVQEIPSKEAILGKIVHRAIELGWNDRDKAYEVARNGIRDNKLSKADRTNMEFQLDVFFLNFRPLLTNNDKIEYNFKIQMYDDVYLVGKMDRVANGNIFDWKTGRISEKLGKDPQCIIYDYAYRVLFNKQATSVNIAHLPTGSLIPYIKDELATKELFENIVPRMIRTIRNSSYERLGIFNHSCFRCAYKLGCLGKGVEDVVDSTEPLT